MSTEQVDAGRELDAAVAEEVMGWKDVTTEFPDSPWMDGDYGGVAPNQQFGGGRRVPRYSTDIAAAWEIIRFTEGQKGWIWQLSMSTMSDGVRSAHANVGYFPTGVESRPVNTGWVEAGLMPEAISRAALKAVRSKGEAA